MYSPRVWRAAGTGLAREGTNWHAEPAAAPGCPHGWDRGARGALGLAERPPRHATGQAETILHLGPPGKGGAWSFGNGLTPLQEQAERWEGTNPAGALQQVFQTPLIPPATQR